MYTNVVWKVDGGHRFAVGIPICLLRVGECVRLTSPLAGSQNRVKVFPAVLAVFSFTSRIGVGRNRSTGDDKRSRGKRLIRRTKIDCTGSVRSFPAVPRFMADDEIHSRSCD